ncbi:MAG: hypothetical protein ACRCX2_37020 [Paraclostridium sp.]
MSLEFFKQIKNNAIEKDKFSKNLTRDLAEEFSDNDIVSTTVDEDKIEETIKDIDTTLKYVKDKINNERIPYDNYFDNDIKKHLDIMHNYINKFVKDYPKYYNDNTVFGKAYLDARDIIMNEMPLTPEQMIESESTVSGIVNDTKLNFDNGFSIDSGGNVYDPNNKIIFKPNATHQKVSHVDLLNKKVITENGIRVDLPDNFIKETIINNDDVSQNFKDRLIELSKKIEESLSTSGSNNGNSSNQQNNGYDGDGSEKIIGKIEDIYIGEKDRIFIEMPLEDTFLGDIFGEEQDINILDQIKKYKVESNSFTTCNFKELPYAELQSLMFWGGGERGVKPLASAEISDKDIIFKPDGTVLYSGANSTVKIKRKGCPSKSFKTGHLMMYSSDNKIGLKRSLLQYLYSFCASIGIFNANIPKLIGFKKFKIFPGLCIGGLLESIIMSWQERISKRINELFQCIPTAMPSDNSFSGFENETYPNGASVETLEDLLKIKSCKYGDKFVVNVVDTATTGLSSYACGQFVFDPNKRLSGTHRWRYGDFSGKPFNKEDVKTIKEFSSMYENPLVKDIMMNTNALGEDSITRKMMSLQFAYLKKEALLTIGDVEASMDATIESVIYEALDKLTIDIARYEYMKELHLSRKSRVPNFESDQYVSEFLEHFRTITNAGILKMPELSKYRKVYKLATGTTGGGGSNGNGAGTVTYEYIDYYDFNSLDHNEYLVPKREHVSLYDTMMFAEKFCPNQQLNDIYETNFKYLESLGQDIGKYKNIKTIADFIKISEIKSAIEIDIKDNLSYIRADLEYDGFEATAFQQVKERCYYLIENKQIFNAS